MSFHSPHSGQKNASTVSSYRFVKKKKNHCEMTPRPLAPHVSQCYSCSLWHEGTPAALDS